MLTNVENKNGYATLWFQKVLALTLDLRTSYILSIMWQLFNYAQT